MNKSTIYLAAFFLPLAVVAFVASPDPVERQEQAEPKPSHVYIHFTLDEDGNLVPEYRDAPTEGALELGEWTIKQRGDGVLVIPAYPQETIAYPNKLSSTITYEKE